MIIYNQELTKRYSKYYQKEEGEAMKKERTGAVTKYLILVFGAFAIFFIHISGRFTSRMQWS